MELPVTLDENKKGGENTEEPSISCLGSQVRIVVLRLMQLSGLLEAIFVFFTFYVNRLNSFVRS